jgi:hypothetical protein
MPEWQVVPGQRVTALHHSAHHMAAFGAGHDLILHQEADAVDETSATAVGRVHLGQSYQIPPAFGGCQGRMGTRIQGKRSRGISGTTQWTHGSNVNS